MAPASRQVAAPVRNAARTAEDAAPAVQAAEAAVAGDDGDAAAPAWVEPPAADAVPAVSAADAVAAVAADVAGVAVVADVAGVAVVAAASRNRDHTATAAALRYWRQSSPVRKGPRQQARTCAGATTSSAAYGFSFLPVSAATSNARAPPTTAAAMSHGSQTPSTTNFRNRSNLQGRSASICVKAARSTPCSHSKSTLIPTHSATQAIRRRQRVQPVTPMVSRENAKTCNAVGRACIAGRSAEGTDQPRYQRVPTRACTNAGDRQRNMA